MSGGPSRGELIFRLVFSLCGLALVVLTVAVRGIANSAALVEVIGIAGLFFGGTALWTARALWRRRDRDRRD
ncbi:hypothetical protein [Roseivivax isoporae]|uniref:Uncharacterized protein n=1 Tax=Roseivivax isoporae LMG 25204 TaxID=1449351 RepID=X7FBG6_9RHOB|nr:hypothetical protein [Roseivivax isoporae]ETX30033.1 hypothetical protein RISW2_20305 [Roseivivax isoporae LMG 25204]